MSRTFKKGTKTLERVEGKLTVEDIKDLRLNHPMLEELILAHNDLSRAGMIEALTSFFRTSFNLKELDCSDCMLSRAGDLTALFKALAVHKNLETVDFSQNGLLTSQMITGISDVLKDDPSLSELNLSENRIPPESFEKLFKNLKAAFDKKPGVHLSPDLKRGISLDLSRCDIDSRSALALARAIENSFVVPVLQVAAVTTAATSDVPGDIVAAAQNPKQPESYLRRLDLSGNSLGFLGADEILKALSQARIPDKKLEVVLADDTLLNMGDKQKLVEKYPSLKITFDRPKDMATEESPNPTMRKSSVRASNGDNDKGGCCVVS